MDFNINISDAIRLRREEIGITQEMAAKRSNMPIKRYINIESGNIMLQSMKLFDIATALETNVIDLLKGPNVTVTGTEIEKGSLIMFLHGDDYAVIECGEWCKCKKVNPLTGNEVDPKEFYISISDIEEGVEKGEIHVL